MAKKPFFRHCFAEILLLQNLGLKCTNSIHEPGFTRRVKDEIRLGPSKTHVIVINTGDVDPPEKRGIIIKSFV
jgi:hypothetical protein